jgi:hypothetical protein
MAKNPKTIKQKDVYRSAHEIKTAAGGLQFQEDTSVGKDGSIVPKQSAFLKLWHIGGSVLRMFHGGMRLESSGDFGLDSKGKTTITSGGDLEVRVAGDFRIYKKGKIINLDGKQDKEQREAAKKLGEVYEKIQKKQKDAIQSTEGDEVPCDICSQEYLVNKKSGFGTRLFKTIRKLNIPYFCYAIDILETLYNFLIAPILDIVTGLGESEDGKGCKNAGCKNGMVKSSQKKLEASNKVAEEAYKENKEQIDKLTNQMACSTQVSSINGDVAITVGLPDLDSGESPYQDTKTYKQKSVEHVPGKSSIFIRGGKGGSVKQICNCNPIPPCSGNATLKVVGKLIVDSGNPGFEFLTRGEGNIKCGGLNLVASEAEATLSSNNLTVVKGKVVEIDANDGSGTEGIILNSKHTRVGGALHVDGNLTLLGSLAIDGNLCSPYLITRSMRLQTTKASSSKTIGNGANWLGVCQAMDAADTTLQTLMRDIMPGQLLDIDGIFTKLMETFNQIMNSNIIEWPMPTGIFAGVCAGVGGGVCTGYVWNWKHNHNITPQSHTHDHTVPMGKYLDTREDWAGARTDGSHVPTPANETGDGTVPGPKSNGGACGGGGGFGLGNPNSRASKARRARNQSFGIIGDDAFGGNDFVNITPNGSFYYDEDGNIQPEDKVNLSIGFECPPDLFENIINDDGSSTGGDGSSTGGDDSGIRDC